MTTFLGRGPLRTVLEAMPVKVILNEKAALLGAAYYSSKGYRR
jgi:glucokinase